MKKAFLIAMAVLVATLATSCRSVPKTIPENLSSSELIQKAQEASDSYNYDAAIVYYQAAMERFGSDPAILCMGEYEIAFIYHKQGKNTASEELLAKLLARYSAPEGVSLPQRFRILAEKILPQVRADIEKVKEVEFGLSFERIFRMPSPISVVRFYSTSIGRMVAIEPLQPSGYVTQNVETAHQVMPESTICPVPCMDDKPCLHRVFNEIAEGPSIVIPARYDSGKEAFAPQVPKKPRFAIEPNSDNTQNPFHDR